jgi:hypothetical protein
MYAYTPQINGESSVGGALVGGALVEGTERRRRAGWLRGGEAAALAVP